VRRWLFESVPRPIAVARGCGLFCAMGAVGLAVAGAWVPAALAGIGAAALIWGAW
jgi:hypothetical protein